MTDFEGLLRTLNDGGVEFILIGGVAAAAHGAARATYDLDILYSRSPANLDRLAAALTPLDPYLRGAVAGLPFRWDAGTLTHGLNFTLTTSLGDLDLMGEVTHGGTYERLLPDTEAVTLFGAAYRVLSLGRLIEVKRAAGRPKDLEAIAELEAIRDEWASGQA
ncbi:MAG: hypothetical protein FJW23_03585 [Acidimicrobiia bacterium]|nr:hypothetical protein [Acidimicrobiia bacterium]